MRHMGREFYEWWDALPDTPEPEWPNTGGWVIWLTFIAFVVFVIGVTW